MQLNFLIKIIFFAEKTKNAMQIEIENFYNVKNKIITIFKRLVLLLKKSNNVNFYLKIFVKKKCFN